MSSIPGGGGGGGGGGPPAEIVGGPEGAGGVGVADAVVVALEDLLRTCFNACSAGMPP